jgi:hypothetical protein
MEPTERTTTAETLDDIAAHFQAAPGTELLYDNSDEHGKTARRLKMLQHLKNGDSHILLVPRLSLTDPNDPLRWSRAKKWACFLIGDWYAFNGAVTGPIMSAGERCSIARKSMGI